jgi:hypothetical protein
LARLIDGKTLDLLGIVKWEVDSIDPKKSMWFDKNEWLLAKVAKTRFGEFENVCKSFFRNNDTNLQMKMKDDKVAYHKDQQIFYW